jgi:hypothetical protein
LEALKFLPGEDVDALDLAAWVATEHWRKTIEPFCQVRFQYISLYAERIGRTLTGHVDAEARQGRERRMEQRNREASASLHAVIMEQGRIAAEGRRLRFRRFAHRRLSP